MSNLFNSIVLSKVKRSAINLSNEVKLTTKIGQLTPFMCQPVLPGDTFKVSTTMLVRLAPLVAPIMHRVNVYQHFFFVPNRLIWDDWETFITGGEDGKQMPSFPRFTVNANTKDDDDSLAIFSSKSLCDYLSYPVMSSCLRGGTDSDSLTVAQKQSLTGMAQHDSSLQYSSLPIRAYNQIWNDYYRDGNLQDEIDFPHNGGIRPLADEKPLLRTRAWEKDYFTSALPWTQRGDAGLVPVNNNAEIIYNPNGDTFVKNNAGGLASAAVIGSDGGDLRVMDQNQPGQHGQHINIDNSSNLEVGGDIDNININDIRTASALQRWLEKSSRVGSRYVEQLAGFFGVVSDDARLQRAEFLGGGRCPIVIGEVPQTSATDSTSPQATLAGKGVSVNSSRAFKRRFKEHGWIIGIMSIMPKPSYMQGCPREYMKFDKFDYYFPEFDHLGEQPIYTREIFDYEISAPKNKIFGYTPRYAEYRFNPNRVCGDFRDNLRFWHMGRLFKNAPALNEDFISLEKERDRLNEVFAVTDTENDPYWVFISNDVKSVRPMSKFGTPKLI